MAQTIPTCKQPRRLRFLAASRIVRAGVVLLFAAALGLITWESVEGRADVDRSKTGRSTNIVGSYLAARHARTEGEEQAAASFYATALKASPSDPMLYRRAITATLLSGRVAEGIRLSEELLKLEPDNPLALFAVAVGRLHDGRSAQAESFLTRIPTDSLLGVAAVLMRAWILDERHESAATAEALDALQALPTVAYLSYLHAAWMLDAAGSSGEAADKLRVVLATQPEPWFRLAELAGAVYLRAGRPEAAAEVIRHYEAAHGTEAPPLAPGALQSGRRTAKAKLASARDGAAEALFDVACVSSRQNQREQALILGFLGLYLKPDFPALQLVVAELMEAADRLPEANKVYQAIDRGSPLSWVARLAAARNLDALDRFSESEALLKNMAKERPEAPEPLIQLGDELRRLERFAEAVPVYDLAVARIGSLDRHHWRLLYARGIALERTKAWDRAEADFLKALEFEADQPFILNYLGYSWVEQGKNLARAEEMIARAVELRPNDGYIVDSLGWVLYRQGRYDSAVEKLERAVELKPEDPIINDHLGDAYWAVGRQREARFQWHASLVRDPEPELRATIEKKLNEGLVREASVVQP